MPPRAALGVGQHRRLLAPACWAQPPTLSTVAPAQVTRGRKVVAIHNATLPACTQTRHPGTVLRMRRLRGAEAADRRDGAADAVLPRREQARGWWAGQGLVGRLGLDARGRAGLPSQGASQPVCLTPAAYRGKQPPAFPNGRFMPV